MSNDQRHIFFRVDANHQIGTGHVMRCFALAEELITRNCKVTFVTADMPEALQLRLKSAGIDLLHQTGQANTPAHFATLVKEGDSKLAVLDGYHLGDEHEVLLNTVPGMTTLRFDDFLSGPTSHASIILNSSPSADPQKYKAWAPDTKLLLGPAYTLFRKDILMLADGPASEAPNISNRIFLNFGGSDPLNLTAKVAERLAITLPDATIEAVTGIAHGNPSSVEGLASDNIRHYHNPPDLPIIMQRAKLAVSAGGSTTHELALLKIPSLLVVTALNQVPNAKNSWCKTLIPEKELTPSAIPAFIDEIAKSAEMMWHDEDVRKKILNRIPKELDPFGAVRIADVLLGGKGNG